MAAGTMVLKPVELPDCRSQEAKNLSPLGERGSNETLGISMEWPSHLISLFRFQPLIVPNPKAQNLTAAMLRQSWQEEGEQQRALSQ
jgi:hypothetical protein